MIEVRPIRPGDLAAVEDLHDRTFPRALARSGGGRLIRRVAAHSAHSRGTDERSLTWVASVDAALAGFVLAQRFGRLSRLRQDIDRHATVARASVHLGRPRPRTLGLPLIHDVWETFDNAATRGALLTEADDRYVTALAVEPRLRRNGAGSALMNTLIDDALHSRAAAIWLHCWDGANASGFYLRHGFLPIVRVGPHYDDQTPATLMVLPLAR